ncbi:hypothetical protein SDC9_199561 [bioreactor metagenome]|uniref:Uncharacterized protein n=1 Tax=bioreactor metagenome TaxID=1076179 RepID=A0A645ILE0_9ZZZZ
MRISRGDVALRFDDAEVVKEPRAFGKRRVALVLQRASLPVGIDVT